MSSSKTPNLIKRYQELLQARKNFIEKCSDLAVVVIKPEFKGMLSGERPTDRRLIALSDANYWAAWSERSEILEGWFRLRDDSEAAGREYMRGRGMWLPKFAFLPAGITFQQFAVRRVVPAGMIKSIVVGGGASIAITDILAEHGWSADRVRVRLPPVNKYSAYLYWTTGRDPVRADCIIINCSEAQHATAITKTRIVSSAISSDMGAASLLGRGGRKPDLIMGDYHFFTTHP